MKHTLLMAFAVTLFSAFSANAAVVSLSGPPTVTAGDSFELQISGDFGAEGLIAGGITLNWDPTLVQFDGIAFALPADPDLSCPGNVNCPPDTASSAAVVWGQFLVDLIAPGAGSTLMATIMFTALDAGAAAFSMVDNSALTGGWFGAGFVPIATPDFEGTSVDIAAVPLPAAAWLFGSAVLGLAGMARRKRG